LNRWILFILICIISFLSTDFSHAMGIIMRVQQMKAQKQGQMTPEQAQQAQEYQEQQQGDHQGSAQSYQQTIDARNQAIAQAIINANNAALSSEAQSTGVIQTPAQTVSPSEAPQAPVDTTPASPPDVQDVVDLTEVWKKLDKKSTVWQLLIDDQAKLSTVSEYIGRFQKEGVTIKESPMHYVQMIDEIAGANPQMLQKPFGEVIQILAIVDYDFDNGMDKDTLAKSVLGEAGYEANKKRFSQ